MKNMGAKTSVVVAETPRAITLTPSGCISYGYVFPGDIVITEDQAATLKEVDPYIRYETLETME